MAPLIFRSRARPSKSPARSPQTAQPTCGLMPPGRQIPNLPGPCKTSILEQYENASSPQERNALLRREGIYTAYISEWRRERDQAEPAPAKERKPGRPGKSPAEAENERLRKENEKLAAKLSKTEAALEIMGKVHALCATRGRTRLSELADWRVGRCRSAA